MKNQPAEEALAELLGWTGHVDAQLSWDDVESAVGVRLPDDFKRLMSRFPTGYFAARFAVWSPVESEEFLQEFRRHWEVMLTLLREVREETEKQYGQRVPYPLYPEPRGLIPWGRGDDLTFYWYARDLADPDNWTVVYSEKFFIEWGEYEGCMSSFLFDVISDRFHDQILGYYPTLRERHYYPSGTEMPCDGLIESAESDELDSENPTGTPSE